MGQVSVIHVVEAYHLLAFNHLVGDARVTG
jgi:hypothetical protein